MRIALASLALVATGCFATLPPQVAEGTTVMDAGGVSLGVSAGAGTFEYQGQANSQGQTAWNNQTAGGFETRLRTGIGGHQELGVSVFGGVGSGIGNGDPPFVLGGKLSYKIAPAPWFAIVAGGGAMDHSVSSTAVFSGDLALIAAPYTSPTGFQFYVATKGAFAIPVLSGSTAVEESIVIPLGLQIPTSKRMKLYAELGPIWGFAQQSQAGGSQSTWSVGPYAIFAFTYQLR
jgi:hypothetical protein